MSLIKRRPGLVLNKGVQREAALQGQATPRIAQGRQAPRCSLGLCVLAPLCLASIALLWEGLYAHRNRAEFAQRGHSSRGDSSQYAPHGQVCEDCPSCL